MTSVNPRPERKRHTNPEMKMICVVGTWVNRGNRFLAFTFLKAKVIAER